MDDIEDLINISQKRRLLNQQKLKLLDKEPDEHRKIMKELRDLKRDTQKCTESITKHLNTIRAHKHTIHKIVHSSEHISGLPVSHDDTQDVKNMFAETINFLNNIEDTNEALNNIKGKYMDSSELIKAVATCTEAVGNELYQTRCRIAQLEALKESISAFQQHILNSSGSNNDEITSLKSNVSTESGSTIT